MPAPDTNNESTASARGNSAVQVVGQVDKRAQQILFNTYWSTTGWTREETRRLSTEDFDYAKSKHLMFDPASLSHDQVISRLMEAVGKLSSRVVADAFVASLSTHRLDWRSALGSYVVWHALQTHTPTKDRRQCECCGLYLQGATEDFSVMNFERLKWGGVRHLHPAYAMLDLELFLEQQAPKPTSEDVDVFRKLLAAFANVPPHVSSAAVQGHFGKVLKSNKAERDCIVAILGYCGILGTPDHPGFAAGFVPAGKRHFPDRRFVDMPYPACWWSSDIGINEGRLRDFFGHIL
jgi:hypothetical protein